MSVQDTVCIFFETPKGGKKGAVRPSPLLKGIVCGCVFKAVGNAAASHSTSHEHGNQAQSQSLGFIQIHQCLIKFIKTNILITFNSAPSL